MAITWSPVKTDTHIYPTTGGGYSDTPANIFSMWGGTTKATSINTQPTLYDITKTVTAEGSRVPLVYGRAQVGGRVFALDYTAPTWTVGYVVAMGEIESYVQVWLDKAAPVAGVTIDYYTGTTGQTANSKLAAKIAGYADDMVISHPAGDYGVAYIVIQYTDSHYKGFPDVVVEIEGKKVYNPKTSTTVYSENPALHLGDLIRSQVYGMGITVDNTDLEAAQDYCDDATPGEVRRTSYQVIDQPRSVTQWVDILRLYASCFVVFRGASAHLIPDKAGTSVMSIGEDDIVASSLSIVKKDSIDLPTVIYATYTDTTSDVWKEAICEPAKAAGVDAGTTPWRESRINLIGIKRHSQAKRECIERLNKLALSDLTVTWQMFDEALELEVGDIVSLSHFYGLTNKLLRITAPPVQDIPGRWSISAAEYDPAAYNDTVDAGPTYPDAVVPDNIVPQAPGNVVATEVTYQLDNGEYTSRLDITWTASANSVVTGYNVEVQDGGSNVVWNTSTTGTEASTGPLLEGVTYSVFVTAFNSIYSSGAASDSELIDGYTTAPAAPATLSGSNKDATVHLYWDASTTTSVRKYEVRYYTTAQAWGDGTTLEIVDGLNLTTDSVAEGTWRFAVKAISTTGVPSTTATEQDIVVAAAPAGGTYTTTYYAASPPAANQIGDLWFDSDDNHPYRANTAGVANISAWDSMRDSTIATAQAAAEAAQQDATDALNDAATANADIADIANDNILSPVEKSQVILQYDTIIAEQSGIDSEATSYGITTEKTAYDGAITSLTSYLGTLTSPVAWNNVTGDTTIVGTTFRTNFKNVYTARQTLLDAIAAAAKVLADAAQADADQALLDAESASVLAGTKAKVFFQPTPAPTSTSIGDLWVNASNNNKLYRADSVGADQIIAGEWELVQDTDIPQAISDAADAQSEAETKNTVFYSNSAPTANKVGDIWVDTTNAVGYRTISYCTALPSTYATAISGSTISSIEATADGKNTVYYSSSNPSGTGYDDGDLHINTTTGVKWLFETNTWVARQDTSIADKQEKITIETTPKTANFNAVSQWRYPCDTETTGAFTMTLPGSPTAGDTVYFFDTNGYFDINPLTIARNSKNIMGLAENLEVDVRYFSGGLQYINTAEGWVLI